MQSQQISLQQFVENLQVIVNQPIWRITHPADGWLFLDLGKQYQDFISDTDGTEKPYNKGEFQLTIKGNWEIIQDGKLIESRKVNSDETQQSYFSRMNVLVANFPIKTVSKVMLSDEYILFDDENNCQLKVVASGNDDSLGLTVATLDNKNQPIMYTHHRYDEDRKSLVTQSYKR